MPPLPGEAIASWVIRLAEAHGQSSRSLSRLLCGRSFDGHFDLSGANGDRLVTALGTATRLGAQYIRSESTPAGLEGRLFVRTGRSTKLPWVLPQGSYQAWRPAMQFCPWCLDDAPSYFRRNWRLSLFSVCTEHFLHLCHVCPACKAPVDLFRVEARYGQGVQPVCWQCGCDLRRAPARRADDVDANMTQEHFTALTFGDAGPRWPAGINPAEYFPVLAGLCTRLSVRNPRLHRWRKNAAQAAGADLPELHHRDVAAFDALADPDLRRPFLRTAAWLLEDWPTRFLEQARGAHAQAADFVPRCARLPGWFLEQLQTQSHSTLPGARS